MSVKRERKAGALEEFGLKLIKTVTATTNEDVSDFEKRDFCVTQACLELKNRRARTNFLPDDFFGEPAWQMMLELYVSHYREEQSTVTNLCIVSDEPQTTALRWIEILVSQGFVSRSNSKYDKRLKLLSLTAKAIDRLDRYFLERAHHII